MFHVYVLVDPRSPRVHRYYGLTTRPDDRIFHHVNQAVSGYKTSPVAIWIKSLLASGIEPRLRVLEKAATEDEGKRLENAYILRGIESGKPILNRQFNRDGWTPEARKRLSESMKAAYKRKPRVLTEEHKQKLAEAARRRWARRSVTECKAQGPEASDRTTMKGYPGVAQCSTAESNRSTGPSGLGK